MSEFLTVAQAAAKLELEPGTVRDQLRSGALKGTKVGRDWLIEPASVDDYRAARLGKPGRKASAPA